MSSSGRSVPFLTNNTVCVQDMLRLLINICLALCCSVSVFSAQDKKETTDAPKKKVYVFNIREEIDKPAWRKTKDAIDEAHNLKADLILIRMNTYGGRVDIADSIRTKILHSQVPVVVLIENNAASAGALISIACDSIYMMSGSTIGAATVVNQEGTPMPDKYQSYMRKKMRSTAEQTGRNPDIAEAMVDPDKSVPGISDSGKVVTFTTKEAIAHGFCEAQVSGIEEALAHYGMDEYEIVKQQLSFVDALLDFFTSSMISGLLIMVIIGGIYFELQSPGIGFPLAAAVIAAVLYFSPLYLEGLAENWEILIFILGLGLVGLEIFVIPGFGVAGVSGIVLLATGLVLSLLDNVGFDFAPINGDAVLKAVFVVLLSSSLALGISVFLAARLLKTSMFNHIALKTDQPLDEGYVGVDPTLQSLVGKEGVAATVLRPAGKVEIEGKLYDATSETGYIDAGTVVMVVRYETAQLVVQKC